MSPPLLHTETSLPSTCLKLPGVKQGQWTGVSGRREILQQQYQETKIRAIFWKTKANGQSAKASWVSARQKRHAQWAEWRCGQDLGNQHGKRRHLLRLNCILQHFQKKKKGDGFLTPNVSECDLTWNWGLYKNNQVKRGCCCLVSKSCLTLLRLQWL